ncbi:hypothetical protein BGZ57DRAFT_861189 [Hyaloscypha finlandica]|nr:hypothetical protein BGZ57DRAFT_861189 [Hyaloscypha finlandica]
MSRSLTQTSVSNPYSDILYNRQHRHPRKLDPTMSNEFVPNSIEDGGGGGGLDDRREYRSLIRSLGHNSDGNANAVAKGAATGGVIWTIGGFVGKKASGGQTGPQYDSVQNTAYQGSNSFDLGKGQKKSAYFSKQQNR